MADTNRPLIIAHRGESHDAPENTLAAIRLAWDRKVPAVEIDVRLSLDGVPVIIHNPTTKELTDRNLQVNRHTLEDLRALDFGSHKGTAFKGEKMPTLQEVLATVPAHGRLVIEIKDGVETIPPLQRAIDRAGCPPETCLLIGFDPEVIGNAKKAMPDIETSWLIDLRSGRGPDPDEQARELAGRARSMQAEGIDLGVDETTDLRIIPALKALGMKTLSWTVNQPDLARRLVAAGIDGITSDRAAWLMNEIGIGNATGPNQP